MSHQVFITILKIAMQIQNRMKIQEERVQCNINIIIPIKCRV
jgi:hypothetical protein